jgi:hypothetical protein
MGDHGYEFRLSVATLAFALIFFGAGPIARDTFVSPAVAEGQNDRKFGRFPNRASKKTQDAATFFLVWGSDPGTGSGMKHSE